MPRARLENLKAKGGEVRKVIGWEETKYDGNWKRLGRILYELFEKHLGTTKPNFVLSNQLFALHDAIQASGELGVEEKEFLSGANNMIVKWMHRRYFATLRKNRRPSPRVSNGIGEAHRVASSAAGGQGQTAVSTAVQSTVSATLPQGLNRPEETPGVSNGAGEAQRMVSSAAGGQGQTVVSMTSQLPPPPSYMMRAQNRPEGVPGVSDGTVQAPPLPIEVARWQGWQTAKRPALQGDSIGAQGRALLRAARIRPEETPGVSNGTGEAQWMAGSAAWGQGQTAVSTVVHYPVPPMLPRALSRPEEIPSVSNWTEEARRLATEAFGWRGQTAVEPAVRYPVAATLPRALNKPEETPGVENTVVRRYDSGASSPVVSDGSGEARRLATWAATGWQAKTTTTVEYRAAATIPAAQSGPGGTPDVGNPPAIRHDPARDM